MIAELQIERIMEDLGDVWGVCEVNGNIFLHSAESLEELKEVMKRSALELEGVTIEEFEVIDIT